MRVEDIDVDWKLADREGFFTIAAECEGDEDAPKVAKIIFSGADGENEVEVEPENFPPSFIEALEAEIATTLAGE